MKQFVTLFFTQLYTSIISILFSDPLRIKNPTTIMIFEHWGETQAFVFDFGFVLSVKGYTNRIGDIWIKQG